MHTTTFTNNTHPPDWRNPVPSGRYNLLVIGGGSAGLVSAVGAAGLGAKVALVEKKYLGGDCLHAGCVPSKALIHASRTAAALRQSADSDTGVTFHGDLHVDFAAVMDRVRRVRAEISYHDSAKRFRDLGIDLFFGAGEFTAPDQFTIGGQTIRFARAIIATGARAAHIPIPGLDPGTFLTNETLFELESQPQRLAIIGAGPIGAEMAQAFARLGSQVALFDRLPTLAALPDPDGQTLIQAALRRDGVQFFPESTLLRVEAAAGERVIVFSHAGQEQRFSADAILLAAGRRPNLEGLGLEAAGVATTPKGITVDDFLRTGNPRIFAAGDVALPQQFTHVADASARIALQNALFFGRKRASALTIPWAIYTDPEIAHIGRFPHEAEAAGIPTATWHTPIGATDRGRTDGADGFVKLYTHRNSDKLVGATIVAENAGELISIVGTAMAAGAGLGTLSRTIFPYPTQAEAIRKSADAWNRTRLTPTVARLFRAWLRLARR
jgi:pyruvate/2-oxoglutarate dehydrogenase complex dihydrolipoamide dehydrogenase (E3) component